MRSDEAFLAELRVPAPELERALRDVDARLLLRSRLGFRATFAGLGLVLGAALGLTWAAAGVLGGAGLFLVALLAERRLLRASVQRHAERLRGAEWTRGASFQSPNCGLVHLDDEGLQAERALVTTKAPRQTELRYDERRHELTVLQGRGKHAVIVGVRLPTTLSRTQGHWLASYFSQRWQLLAPPRRG